MNVIHRNRQTVKFMSAGAAVICWLIFLGIRDWATAATAYGSTINMIHLHLGVPRLRNRHLKGGKAAIICLIEGHLMPWTMFRDYYLHKNLAQEAVKRIPSLNEKVGNINEPKYYYLSIEDLESIRDHGYIKKY